MRRAFVGARRNLPVLSTLVLDVQDMARARDFWTQALGYVVSYQHETFVALVHPDEPGRARLGLQPADGAKVDVNRVHLDLTTPDPETERARLEALGATRVEDWPYAVDEPDWIVMRDPDGNEFCLVDSSSPAES